MKLNNKGWGLLPFLTYIAIFMLIIFITAGRIANF